MSIKYTASISVTSYPGKDGKTFDYALTGDDIIAPGTIVSITFGPKKTLGVVASVQENSSKADTKGHAMLPIEGALALPSVPSHFAELAYWMMDYYAASAAAVWRTMLPTRLTQKARLKVAHEESSSAAVPTLTLNSDQVAAVDTVTNGDHQGYLLHGITGSGKTEVYIELIKRQLAAGKSVMVLVPEIALTPQMVERLSAHFGSQLTVSHSKLTPARRKLIWLEALSSTEPRVYLGPRSILFLPLSKLGLIIVDEEHESSYKQENAPTYQVNTVVAKLSSLTGARFVLGSATPSIYTYHMAKLDRIGYIELRDRALGAALPEVEVVKLEAGSMLSPQLVREVQTAVRQGKQTILFLNRRGSASSMICDNCGHIETCPNCDTSLTFHADLARLLCHYCAFKKLPPTTCPDCEKRELHFVGSGTKRVEEEISNIFQGYRVRRLDGDNATLEYIESVYKELRNGKTDIIIGTQMIARGLDLPNVTTVGVISAESMLAIPDFSSSERTFSLLTQVAGRAGRAEHAGKVILQTHSPNHPAVVAASHHDYESFYSWESQNRKAHAYPPYAYLVKLVYGHRDPAKAAQAALALADSLRRDHSDITVLGPVERALKRVAGRYQQQVIVKSRDRTKLADIARGLKAGWKHDLDPINLM